MLEKRQTKRLAIIIIYIFIFSLIASLFYWIFRPSPTCHDGKKNQGEEEIDCGGPCKACPVVIKAKDLEIEKQRFINSSPKMYDVVIKIKNPNEQYGAKSFRYNVKLLDANNKVLVSRSGYSFILPREEKYLIETNLKIKNDYLPHKMKVTFENYDWKEFTQYNEKPQLNVYQKRYEKVNSPEVFGAVYGLVKNDSPFDFNSVIVKVVLKNKAGDILAVNSTQMNTLTAGEERDFRLIWPRSFPGNVFKIEVEPEANVYDSLNFTKKYLPHQKFQNYENENWN